MESTPATEVQMVFKADGRLTVLDFRDLHGVVPVDHLMAETIEQVVQIETATNGRIPVGKVVRPARPQKIGLKTTPVERLVSRVDRQQQIVVSTPEGILDCESRQREENGS